MWRLQQADARVLHASRLPSPECCWLKLSMVRLKVFTFSPLFYLKFIPYWRRRQRWRTTIIRFGYIDNIWGFVLSFDIHFEAFGSTKLAYEVYDNGVSQSSIWRDFYKNGLELFHVHVDTNGPRVRSLGGKKKLHLAEYCLRRSHSFDASIIDRQITPTFMHICFSAESWNMRLLTNRRYPIIAKRLTFSSKIALRI